MSYNKRHSIGLNVDSAKGLMGGGSLGFSTADGRKTQFSIKAAPFGMTQNSNMV